MGIIEHSILLVASWLIKWQAKDKLLILNYHSIKANGCFFSSDVDTQKFDWQMHLISRYFHPVKMSTAASQLSQRQLSAGSVAITFDDGYRDNIIEALPILKKYDLPATFFIATGFLNGGIMWNDMIIESIKRTKKQQLNLSFLGLPEQDLKSKKDRLELIEKVITQVKHKIKEQRLELVLSLVKECDIQLPIDLMMQDEDIIYLQNENMEIGGHTVNHPILASENEHLVQQEIIDGKHYLENLIKSKLSGFAYPNGRKNKDYKKEHVQIVKKNGFDYAVTTNAGLNDDQTDPMEFYRFTPWDQSPVRFMLRILKLYTVNRI